MRVSEGHVEFLASLSLTELAEYVTASLDAVAGPRGLDHWDAWIQRCCRRRFGIYDPGLAYQADYIDQLRSLQRRLEAA